MVTKKNTQIRMSCLFKTVEEVEEVEKAVKKINAQNKKDSFGNELTRSKFMTHAVLEMARKVNDGSYKFKAKK